MRTAKFTLLALAMLGAASVSAASEPEGVTVRGQQELPRHSRDARGVQACAEAFIGKLLPGATLPTRIHMGRPTQILDTGTGGLLAEKRMNVRMTATASKTGEALASSFCVVDRSARVLELGVYQVKSGALATLKPADVKLAVSLR